MNDVSSETDSTFVDMPKGPSAVLVEAREKLGLSQRDVADQLFLKPQYIKNIDDGEFDRIPKQAFVRGYLRSYARTVELDGNLIVELYDKERQRVEPEPEFAGVTEEKVGAAHITGSIFNAGTISLCLLLVVIGLVWSLVDYDETESSLSNTLPAASGNGAYQTASAADSYVGAPMSRNLARAVDDYMSVSGDEDKDNEMKNVEKISVEMSLDTAQIASVAAIESTAAEASRAEAETVKAESQIDNQAISVERFEKGPFEYITVDAGGLDELLLTFGDECWVEVSDGRHEIVYYEDLHEKGDVLTIYGTLTFEVLLGKATVVEMLYNGAPVDLEPYIGRDKTAKIYIAD